MDGIDEKGPLFWASPTANASQQHQSSLGLVGSWTDPGDASGGAAWTWVFTSMDRAQHFVDVAGPPGLVLAIWKKGKRAEFMHSKYVRGTLAPATAAP